jgi:hypothetical protein
MHASGSPAHQPFLSLVPGGQRAPSGEVKRSETTREAKRIEAK